MSSLRSLTVSIMDMAPPPVLRRVWIAGLVYAGLLCLTGLAGWWMEVEPASWTLIGYGGGAVGVVVFSRGLYHRSLVSGVFLFGVAVGPGLSLAVRGLTGAAVWGGGSVFILMTGVALAGLVVAGFVGRALWLLWVGGEVHGSGRPR